MFHIILPMALWPALRDRMLLPTMQSIVAADSKKRLNATWLRNPPSFLFEVDRVVVYYYRLCWLLKMGLTDEAKSKWFISEFFSNASSMVHAMFLKEKSISPEATTRILCQLTIIDGEDPVLKHVRSVAEDPHRLKYATLFGVVEYFNICGALPHVLQLSRTVLQERPDDPLWVRSIEELISHVETAVEKEGDRRLTVVMSLCGDSPLGMLGIDLLQIICCDFPTYTPIVQWKDLV
jgi:hypothetical protein